MITAPRDSRFILCLLAGGRSSRLGASKMHLRLNDEPIIAWQVRRLLPAGQVYGEKQGWINLAPGVAAPPGSELCSRRIDDPVAFHGPLAGMLAVLEQAQPGDTVAFMPVDMPALEPEHLVRMIELAHASPDVIGVMSRWENGTHKDVVEPLPSLWHAGPAVAVIREAMTQGISGPSGLTTRRGVECMGLNSPADELAWRSINERSDLEAIARSLGVTYQIPSAADRGV